MSSQILETREAKVSPQAAGTELLFGKPLLRKEDRRLIIGDSKYVDDIELPNLLYGAVVRSAYAHARIKSIDTSLALQVAGVKLVLTARELPENTILPTLPTSDGTVIGRPVLALDEVSFVGEGIAFVVADTRQGAEDALELVRVDYEVLPSVMDMEEATKKDGPLSHSGISTNVAMVDRLGFGNVDATFKDASKVVKVDYSNQRLAPCPLEPRACLALFQRGTETLTLWISTQAPFLVRSVLSDVLRFPENRIRVIGPEVGGGFGAKISIYPEDVLVCIASMILKTPVKWIETRTENFLSMTHGRGQNQHVEIAADSSGRIRGMKVRLVGDAGPYLTPDSSDVTMTLKMIPGTYVVPSFDGEAIVVFTNKVLHESYRGAARPEATYAIERAMDELARALAIDPAELRLRNFIPQNRFPYRTISGFTYDSGNYALCLQKALDYSDYDKWREEQKRAKGYLVGIGIASYVEICGFDPDTPQTASIFVSPSGKVMVTAGTFPHGQGHETPFAQIVGDILGIPIDSIQVSYGDTAQLPWGTFTAGSRSAALGGTAVQMCAKKIKEKMAKIAAKNLGTDFEDIVFESGKIFSKSGPDRSKSKLSFQDVASFGYKPAKLPEGMEPVLFAFSAFAPPDYTFPFGTHVAIVEVEKETGLVKVLSYTSVDDCGNVINPLIVEGQVHGGIVQGLGQALLEGVKYDAEGQLLTSSFIDYQIPIAEDIPTFRNYRTVTPSPWNPLGIKGIGEAGTIAATPALINAIADALSLVNAKIIDMPATPDYIYSLVNQSVKS